MTVAFLNKSSHARPESSQKTHFITSIDSSIFGHLIISASTAAGVNDVLHAAEKSTAIKSQPGFVGVRHIASLSANHCQVLCTPCLQNNSMILTSRAR